MRILCLSPGSDTGGQSSRGAEALRAGGHEVRAFTRSHHKFGYPRCELWVRNDTAAVAPLLDWADAVVLNNDPHVVELLDPSRARRRPPVVLLHHGSRFRGDPGLGYAAGAAIGAVQAVSTVDLLLSAPGEAFWLPQVIDAGAMAAIRAEAWRPGPRVRLAHAPTNRLIKGTAMVQTAARAAGVELVLIERHQWAACLRRKAAADVYADQFLLGYGNNAVEAWAMGMPVLAGAPPDVLARMRSEYGGPVPFMESDGHTLRGNIAALAASADLRAEWAAVGRAHVAKFHEPGPWLARMEFLLDLAVNRHLTRAESVA